MSRFLRIVRRFATATKSLQEWYSRVPPEQIREIPLLSSLEKFEASLPVREINGGIYKLHEQEMWVREDDIQTMADELERESSARSAVKYLAAPTQYGKTSFPLRAFLASTLREPTIQPPFKHYIYIAFSNNGSRNYVLDPPFPSPNLNTAFKQGAEFMLKCLEDAINNPSRQGVREIPLNDKPSSSEATLQAFENLFAKFNGRILIHIDEHRGMCDRVEDPLAGANFSSGAMSVLSRTPRVTVLSTYTNMPPLPPLHSSQTCRDPVSVPTLDVDAMMQAFPELEGLQRRVNATHLDREEKRLWASLRFRLALRLRSMPLATVQVGGAAFKDFLSKFKAEAARSNLKEELKGCCRLCTVALNRIYPNHNAAKLLMGVLDIEHEEFHRQVSNLVVYKGWVTCDFKSLLEISDPTVPVYDCGRDLMRNILRSNVESDLTANSPLEAAYFWALSTMAQYGEALSFGIQSHAFKCLSLEPGRIFPKDDPKTTNRGWIKKIAPGVLYYADEKGKGKSTHPLFDCWFRSSRGTVLCDITGGKDDQSKAAALDQWIKTQQPKTDQVLHGVILAPNVEGPSETFEPKDGTPSNVTIVRGVDAIDLLGGLGQVFRWM